MPLSNCFICIIITHIFKIGEKIGYMLPIRNIVVNTAILVLIFPSSIIGLLSYHLNSDVSSYIAVFHATIDCLTFLQTLLFLLLDVVNYIKGKNTIFN